MHTFNSTTDNWILVGFLILLKYRSRCDKSPSFLGSCQQAQNAFSESWNHPSKHESDETGATLLGGDWNLAIYLQIFRYGIREMKNYRYRNHQIGRKFQNFVKKCLKMLQIHCKNQFVTRKYSNFSPAAGKIQQNKQEIIDFRRRTENL